VEFGGVLSRCATKYTVGGDCGEGLLRLSMTETERIVHHAIGMDEGKLIYDVRSYAFNILFL
jgi:hypothetical protein